MNSGSGVDDHVTETASSKEINGYLVGVGQVPWPGLVMMREGYQNARPPWV